MAQWSNQDASSNSVLWAPTGFNLPANTTNRDALFGNTTVGAFVPGLEAGMFGVDVTEMGVSNGSVIQTLIVSGGSGYGANATVTVTEPANGSGFLANAHVTSNGRIDEVKISAAGSGYSGLPPTFVIAAPAAVVFNGNTAVSANAIAISTANSKFLVGDRVLYAGNATSTPVGLVDQTYYYVSFSNTTVIKLAATLGGANLTISSASGDNTTAGGATVQGERATGVAIVSGSRHGAHHSGWVIRTVGTGGRAGRVQHETLVAMGSMNNTTDAEDTVFKDV
jgi:hypothetical protein